MYGTVLYVVYNESVTRQYTYSVRHQRARQEKCNSLPHFGILSTHPILTFTYNSNTTQFSSADRRSPCQQDSYSNEP
jgi:hypothetical protein